MASFHGLTAIPKQHTELVWVKSWDAQIPPPINSFKGKVVPRLFLKNSRHRRVTIEVHRVYPSSPGSPAPDSSSLFYEQCVIRILVPSGNAHGSSGSVSSTMTNGRQEESEHDESTIVPQEFIDDGSPVRIDADKWKAKYRFPLKNVTITNSHKNCVSVHIVFGSIRQHRELFFESDEDARDFAQVIQAQLDKEPQRVTQKLNVTAQGVPLNDDESLTLLVDICSARNLTAGDRSTSDPYVTIMFNGKEVHRTDYVSKSLDPIWTVKTNSLFLWTVSTKDLFVSDGLLCVVYDFDQVGSHEHLGQVFIPPKILYEASEERIELALKHHHHNDGPVLGYLAIRCRRASLYDQNFMRELADTRRKEKREEAMPELQKIKNLTKLATESAGGSGNVASMLARRTKIVKSDEYPEGLKMYKVRPAPDPSQPKETIWMSKKQLEEESLKESREWIDSGSGSLGFLYVEVIGCDDLPNLDTGGFVGNKTDAFVAIVFEDNFVKTDVIDDCLAPRWMPWTKRAFMFRIMHSSSQLFLGVFDHDVSFNPADGHDFIGRVSIDLSNLRKDTFYTLTYNLYTSARMSHRKRRGRITVRLRLEVDDDRHLLLSSLEPPPRIRVNTKNWKDYHVARCTCTGKTDINKYNMQFINSYIEELLALQQVGFYVKDAATSLILWRATKPLCIKDRKVSIPFHSCMAFVLSALLVEFPQFLPSFFFFGIAWLLLATMEYRIHLPDVWGRCKSYTELLECLVLGESKTPADSIAPYTDSEAADAFNKEWQARIAEVENAASKAYEMDMMKTEEDMIPVSDTESMILRAPRRGSSISLDPFRPILFPIQQNLAFLCRMIRHIKYILFWEECYITFWIVSACLLLGCVFLFVPWFFLLQWTARLLVWTFLGPWMKLVDVFYVRRDASPGANGLTGTEDTSKRVENNASSIIQTRIELEEKAKLRAMKEYMFGKYVVRVPILKEDRYRDVPLPESWATPYQPPLVPLSELAMHEAGYRRHRLVGQHITGRMIPQVETNVRTDAPIGRATAKPQRVNREEPGGKIAASGSTVGAYIQIGLLVIAAGLLTWVGVPFVSFLAAKHMI